MPDRKQDLTGRIFGHLTVLKKSSKRGTQGEYCWLCQCDCGKTTIVTTSSLNGGITKSCGHIKLKNLQPSKKRHSSQLSDKLPTTNKSGYRNISKTFINGHEQYRVAVMYNRHQHGGVRNTLEEALAFREELRKKYWPNYMRKK